MNDLASVMPLFPLRVFDLAKLAGSSSEDVVVNKAVDVAKYGAAVLLVRVHANSLASQRSIVLSVQNTAPSPDDPDEDFVEASTRAVLTLDATASAGEVFTDALEPGFGSHVRLTATLRNTSGSSSAGGAISLSADLVLRVGTPIPIREMGDFAYADSLAAARAYIPFRGTGEGSTIGGAQTRLMAYPGVLERVGLYATSTPGTTTVGFHKNDNPTPNVSVTKGMNASTVTEFEFSSENDFVAGDRIHISVDPATTPGTVNGYYVLRYRRTWG